NGWLTRSSTVHLLPSLGITEQKDHGENWKLPGEHCGGGTEREAQAVNRRDDRAGCRREADGDAGETTDGLRAATGEHGWLEPASMRWPNRRPTKRGYRACTVRQRQCTGRDNRAGRRRDAEGDDRREAGRSRGRTRGRDAGRALGGRSRVCNGGRRAAAGHARGGQAVLALAAPSIVRRGVPCVMREES
ncbi:hypothetical protein Dimus_016230, partial [Dionaea muscipula]